MLGVGEGWRERCAGFQRAEEECRCDLVAVFEVTGQGISDAGWINGLDPPRQRRFWIEPAVEDGGTRGGAERCGVGQRALKAWRGEAADDGVQHSEPGHASNDAKKAEFSHLGDGFYWRFHRHEAETADVETPTLQLPPLTTLVEMLAEIHSTVFFKSCLGWLHLGWRGIHTTLEKVVGLGHR